MGGVETMNKEAYLTKIVAASLLGDGSVHIPNDGSINAAFSMAQVVDHRDHVDFIKNLLEDITRVKTWEIQPKLGNSRRQYHMQTMRHPFYTKFRHRMYGTGIKAIDPHYLTFMDYEMLAIWYMQDGSLSTTPHIRETGNYNRKELFLYSNSFSYGDNMLLKDCLKEKFAIESNIRHSKGKTGNITYFLSIYKKCIDTFLEGVTPFIQPSFQYKLQVRTVDSLKKDDDIVQSV